MGWSDASRVPAVSAVQPAAARRFQADLSRLCDPDDGGLLLAVSGGVDSLALLLLAHAAMPGRVNAATVDHGLRPAGAAEAAFVADVCARLGMPHAVLAGVLPARVRRTANLSSRARVLRYELLEAHRVSSGCAWIATAHQADDQLETLAMRLNRGAGLAGLAGIRERVGAVVRPLLAWRRAELASVVDAAGLVPVFDPTNSDDRFDRARLRKALSGANWLDADRWGVSAAALAESEDALDWCVRRLARDRIVVGVDGVTLAIADDPPEVLRRLVADALLMVDPEAILRGGEVRRLVGRLRTAASSRRSMKATLAGVAISLRLGGDGCTAEFRLAPPRRTKACVTVVPSAAGAEA